MIRVVVHGALGRMGQESLKALCSDSQLEPVGGVDIAACEERLSLPGGSKTIPLSPDIESLLTTCKPDVLLDFSVAEAAMPAVRIAVQHKVNLVIGTTGLTDNNLREIDQVARSSGVGAIVAPNFSLGMIVALHLAEIAAKYFDFAEIIEMHHERKLDAPSGTALATAKAMLESRGSNFSYAHTGVENLAGTRGGSTGGITIHSVRLPGLMAHQEIILGAPGQTLTIRHDTISRECYMPGVVMAIKKVGESTGLVYGLESLLGL